MKRHQIYFLQRADGLIKIGTTSNFEARLAQLSTSHGMLGIIRVINGGQRRERALHRQFKRFHEYGEWFRPEHGTLVALIEKLEEGEPLVMGESEAATEWQQGEALLMAEARDKIAEMVVLRRQRTGLFAEAAMAALTEDYGFSKHFLSHVGKGRALTISAYGWQKIREAYSAELVASLHHFQSEIREIQSTFVDDDEILSIGRRLREVEEEMERRAAERQRANHNRRMGK